MERSTAPTPSPSFYQSFFFFHLLLVIAIAGASRHASTSRHADFTTIAEQRYLSLPRIASISLSPQFPHSRQVFSSTLVHGERAPSVISIVSDRAARGVPRDRICTLDTFFLWRILPGSQDIRPPRRDRHEDLLDWLPSLRHRHDRRGARQAHDLQEERGQCVRAR